jgi:hypothetical protein
MAVDFAAKAFPEVRPETKLEDPAPLMHAPVSPYLPALDAVPAGSRVALGAAGLAAIAGTLFVIARLRPRPARHAGSAWNSHGMGVARWVRS